VNDNIFLVTSKNPSSKEKKFLVYADNKDEAKKIIKNYKDPLVFNNITMQSFPELNVKNIKVENYKTLGEYLDITYEGIEYHFSYKGDARTYGKCDCTRCEFKRKKINKLKLV
jgi:hypothetical protein